MESHPGAATAPSTPHEAPVTPIRRPSLHDEVTARVRDLIVDGTLAAGSPVHEVELAGQLGVSRTPVREALKVLASEGLVDLLPGRGAVVKVFTAKDAQDMLALIALLEQHAGERAVHAGDAEIAAIVALHEKMREHYARRERPEYFRLNQEIHNAIVRAAGSPTLSMLHVILRARMRSFRYIGNPHENRDISFGNAIGPATEINAGLVFFPEGRFRVRLKGGYEWVFNRDTDQSWNAEVGLLFALGKPGLRELDL